MPERRAGLTRRPGIRELTKEEMITMELKQALREATATKRSQTYVLAGTPEYIAAELDHLEAQLGNITIAELIEGKL